MGASRLQQSGAIPNQPLLHQRSNNQGILWVAHKTVSLVVQRYVFADEQGEGEAWHRKFVDVEPARPHTLWDMSQPIRALALAHDDP